MTPLPGRAPSAASRVSAGAAALREAGWLSVLVVTPLLFEIDATEAFETVKAAMVRGVAILIVAASAASWIASSPSLWSAAAPARPRGRGWRPVGAAIAVGAGTAVSALLSISPHTSAFGAAQRSQGALTTAAYLVVFFAVAFTLRTERQWRRLTTTLVVASVPVAGYAVVQRLGLDPVVWQTPVPERVGSTLGNPIFLGAYLVFPLFAAVDALVSARARQTTAMRVCFSAVIVLQLVALLSTGSRGPLLALLVGAVAYCLLIALESRESASDDAPAGASRARLGRVTRAVALAGAVAMVVVVAVLAAIGLSAPLRERVERWGILGRFAYTFVPSTPTAQVRTLAWRAVAELISSSDPILVPGEGPDRWHALRPLFGYGPDTLALVVPRFVSPELARLEPGQALDRAHNDNFEVLATFGLAGIAALLWLDAELLLAGFAGSRKTAPPERESGRFWSPLPWMAGGAALGAFLVYVITGSAAYWGLGLGAGMIVGFLLPIAVALLPLRRRDPHTAVLRLHSPHLAWVLAALIAHLVEIQLGVAVTTTRVLFWVLAGAVVAATRAPQPDDSAVETEVEGAQAADGDAGARALIAALIASTLAVALGPHALLAAGGSHLLAGASPAPEPRAALAAIAILVAAWLAAVMTLERSGPDRSAVGRSHRRFAVVGLVATALAAGPLLFLEARREQLLVTVPDAAVRLARHAERSWAVWLVAALGLTVALAFALRRDGAARARHPRTPAAGATRWQARSRARSLVAHAAALVVLVAVVALLVPLAYAPVVASMDAHYAALAIGRETPDSALVLAGRAVANDSHQAYYYALLARAQLLAGRKAPTASERARELERAVATVEQAALLFPLDRELADAPLAAWRQEIEVARSVSAGEPR